jgi:glucose/arabinose dehydrogenase
MPRPILALTALLALCAGASSRLSAQSAPAPCAPGNVGLTLPEGFCAVLVADSLGNPRHIVAARNGDLLAATRSGHLLVLRDTTGDGLADIVRRTEIARAGHGIALAGRFLYFSTDEAVLRFAWRPGQLEPSGPPDTIVSGLISRRQHAAKSIAVTAGGELYVAIGAPSNNCQERDRALGSLGQDPCTLLDTAGGIWRFSVRRLRQTQANGRRFVTGLRNVVALTHDAATGLWGVQHGRDQLGTLFPDQYTPEANAESPAEELFRFVSGANYGWPYCYYDPALRLKVLAPEYGGDGRTVGRCARYRRPLVAFPAHWAPNAIQIYRGLQFPARYRGGAFVAFHGSWNRAPLPQQGYNVVFVPFARGRPTGAYEVFADGFRTPDGATTYRPTGLAVGPDGSLYVSDDRGGRIYRIAYRGR